MSKSNPKSRNVVAARRIAPAKKPFLKRLGSAVVDTAKDREVQIVVGGAVLASVAIIGAGVILDRYVLNRE